MALTRPSKLIKEDISGSFTTVSSSLASKVTTLEGTGTVQGVGTTNSPTFADVTATGTVTAQEFHTEFISASVLYDSGSTRFGDTTDDTHAFTGSLTTSGSSLKIDSAGTYSGSSTSTGSFGRVEAANYSGDGSALTGIDIPTAAAISGSIVGGVSGSATSTGSFGRVEAAGDVELKAGNLIIGTHGKGIDFSANTDDAGGMTAEILDDYEEGKFDFVATSAAGTIGLNTDYNEASYVKVGSIVHFQCRLHNNTFSGGDGIVTFTGLPFTSAASFTENDDTVAVLIHIVGSSASEFLYAGLINEGVTTIIGYQVNTSYWDNDVDIFISGSYRV